MSDRNLLLATVGQDVPSQRSEDSSVVLHLLAGGLPAIATHTMGEQLAPCREPHRLLWTKARFDLPPHVEC